MRLLRRPAPRMPQEDNAERLREASQRQPPNQRQTADHNQRKNQHLKSVSAVIFENSKVKEKLAGKPVQRRQTRYRRRPNQKRRCRPRHPFHQTPKFIQTPGSAAVQNRTGTQKKKPLKNGVIEYMKQTARKSEHRQDGGMQMNAQQTDP